MSRIAVLAAFLAVSSFAAEDPIARCRAAKLRAVAKKTSATLKCQAPLAVAGAAPGAACLRKVEDEFDQTWKRIEAKGRCPGTAADVESRVDAYVTEVVTTIGCGTVNGVCGGICPAGLSCFEIGVGCYGEPEPCRCHGSTTTCSSPTTSSTTEATSTSTTETTTSTSSCPTYTSTTLGLPDCSGGSGSCLGGCANGRECVPDAADGCGCTGPLLPCGIHSFAGTCAGECPLGEVCISFSPILPDGCPDAPRCGCVQAPGG